MRHEPHSAIETRRLGFAAIAALAAIGLASCGQGAGGNGAGNPADAFNNSFNAAFDKSTHDSCVPSAVAHGASAAGAERYCTCVVAQLDKLTVQQKMSLNGSSPELPAAASACTSQLQP